MIQYINRSTVYFIILAMYAAMVAFIIHSVAQDVEKIQPIPSLRSIDRSLPSASGSALSEALPRSIEGPSVIVGGYTIRLEIANTPSERARGLSNRSYLHPESGMLFLFDRADYHTFWMKDTLIGLDFIWINGSIIVDITRNVPPPSAEKELSRYTPRSRVDKVIEVNAGWIDEHFGSDTPVGERIEFAL